MNEFWNGTITLKASHLCIYLMVCLVCLIISIIFSYINNKPIRKFVKQRTLFEKELARNCVSIVEEWANSTFAIYSKAYSILWDKMLPDYSTGKLVEWCSKCWKQHYVDEDNARTQKLITMTRNFNESLKKQGLI